MLKNITLELSSKAFPDESTERMREVCTTMFTQWKPLTEDAEQVSVMLWLADGSEIFEFTGKLDDTFEWAYWLGCANPIPMPANAHPRMRLHTHHNPVTYIPTPAPRPYRWLKQLVSTLKEIGNAITGKPIRIGATYDNGPEFAISEFKYRRHREICQGHTMYPNSVVTCTATFHADTHPYAAFPNGIPEGTSVGTFLGAQFKLFAKALGFDYLWLSNGMGFGTETWGITGILFDKQAFHPENATKAATLMLQFWHDLFEAYPDIEIETRGSNFSAGLEIATDACPIRELYAKQLIAPPVNSPWAALNFNTGLELAAWMSHIANLPDDRIPFRFYTHDPWFLNSPWLDRYQREPWDIFQPLSIARIAPDGSLASANSISFLSVDDSWGRLPEQVPSEVIPLLKDALAHAPDAPGPFLWLYPFDEYSELVRDGAGRPDIVFSEEFFIGECLQCGFPLNTVVSTAIFRQLSPDKLAASILLVPISATLSDANRRALESFLASGGQAIFYGAISYASPWLRKLLQLEEAAPILGDVDIRTTLEEDAFDEGTLPSIAHIFPQHTCGGLTEVAAPGASSVIRATANQGETSRVSALTRLLPSGGRVGFVRCLLPAGTAITPTRNFDYAASGTAYPVPSLMRKLLTDFGWRLHCNAFSTQTTLPRLTVARHDNAFLFTVLAVNTTVEMRVNTPWGAPILTAMDTRIDAEGAAIWHPGRCWHKECRLFVKQRSSSVITAIIERQAFPQYHDRHRRLYHGFRDAEVRFFIPKGYRDHIEIILSAESETSNAIVLTRSPLENVEWESTPLGECALLHHITGTLHFAIIRKP